VIINDGSTDNTEAICHENGFNYLSLPVNLGIGGAVQCGYLYARNNDYDIAVQLDGDGQHDVSDVETIIEPLIDNEADMVIGSRFITKEGFQSSGLRRFGSLLIRWIIRLCCGAKITDPTSGFRATNRLCISLFAREYANDYPEPEAIVSAILNGFKVIEKPVKMYHRGGGESSISSLRALYYMLKVPLALIIYRLSIRKGRKE